MKPFKIPNKLKVGAHTLIISRNSSHLPDGETMGFFDSSKNQITIAPKLPPTQELVTFIHEVIHAINSEISEPITDAIAQGLASVLVDNNIIKIKT